MKRVSTIVLLILFSTFVLNNSLRSDEIKEVIAEGVAPIKNGDIESAKNAALLDAKRNAVDQVGSEVISETVVSNYQLVRDRIISKVAGYVHQYKILEEGKRGKNYYVKIRAKVSAEALKNDARMIYAQMNKPRIMILITEVKDNKAQLSSQGENALIGFFKEKGFQIVDASRVKAKIERSKLRILAEGNELQAAKLGYREGAEVVITGQVIVSKPESIQGVLYGAKSTVTLRAIDASTGRIYAVETSEGKGVDAVGEGAVRKAVEDGVRKAAEKIFWKIVKEWNNIQLNGQDIEVTVRGVSYSSLKRLMKKIKRIKGVKEVIKRSFDKPVAELSVKFLGDPDRLADLLDRMRLGKKHVEINEVSSGGIEIILK